MLSCPYLRTLSTSIMQKEGSKLLKYAQSCPFAKILFERVQFSTDTRMSLANQCNDDTNKLPEGVVCDDVSECTYKKCPYVDVKNAMHNASDCFKSGDGVGANKEAFAEGIKIPHTCALFAGWKEQERIRLKSSESDASHVKAIAQAVKPDKKFSTAAHPDKSFLTPSGGFDYSAFFDAEIERKRKDSTYRVFRRVLRDAKEFPYAEDYSTGVKKRVAVWCSNDYLGLSWHPRVQEEAIKAIRNHGVGSGGTRNISGNTILHEALEAELADLHGKPAGLVFTSCYVANEACLHTLGARVPGLVILSDAGNHASMIHGIRTSRAEKIIYRHNDVAELAQLAGSLPREKPKLIAFETVHSMTGDVCPLEALLDVAEEHKALSFVDEVHAVGLYGDHGAGVAERDSQMHRIDAITGTLGKAFASVGGYLVGSRELVDMIRSYASGFIFTTSLPPAVLAAARQSIAILRSDEGRQLRARHQHRVAMVRQRLLDAGIPVISCPSHIIPVHVGDPKLSTRISQELLSTYNIYVQAINYPTVAKGDERLRIAPSPHHTDALTDQLVEAMTTVWRRLQLPFLPSPATPPGLCRDAALTRRSTLAASKPLVAAS